jgi:hypothetical protein
VYCTRIGAARHGTTSEEKVKCKKSQTQATAVNFLGLSSLAEMQYLAGKNWTPTMADKFLHENEVKFVIGRRQLRHKVA